MKFSKGELQVMQELWDGECLDENGEIQAIDLAKIMKEKYFIKKENGAVIMTDEGRKDFLSAWQSKKQETIKHPFLDEKIEWGMAPYVQSMLLARYLRGDLDEYPPFFWK